MKKYILGLTIISSLFVASVGLAMEKEKKQMPQTSLSEKQITELRRAIVDYKNDRSRAKQEKIINKYQQQYPNDPFVKAKLNEKARFDNSAQPQITKKLAKKESPKKEPVKQKQVIEIQKQERPKNYKKLDDVLFTTEVTFQGRDPQDRMFKTTVNWQTIFAILDSMAGSIDVNEYYNPEDGFTLLMIASDKLGSSDKLLSSLTAAKTLLEKYKANPNIPIKPVRGYESIRGATPLMRACIWRNDAMVKLLLEHGANPYQKDEKGWDSFDWAKDIDEPYLRSEILEVLKQYKK